MFNPSECRVTHVGHCLCCLPLAIDLNFRSKRNVPHVKCWKRIIVITLDKLFSPELTYFFLFLFFQQSEKTEISQNVLFQLSQNYDVHLQWRHLCKLEKRELLFLCISSTAWFHILHQTTKKTLQRVVNQKRPNRFIWLCELFSFIGSLNKTYILAHFLCSDMALSQSFQ